MGGGDVRLYGHPLYPLDHVGLLYYSTARVTRWYIIQCSELQIGENKRLVNKI